MDDYQKLHNKNYSKHKNADSGNLKLRFYNSPIFIHKNKA